MWKKIPSPGVGDAQHFSGSDINRISDLFSGVSDADGIDFNSIVKFRDQKMILRDPTNSFSLTVRNPVIGANSITQFDGPYNYIIFIDTDDSNLVKAKNGHTGAIESSNSNARITIQFAIDKIANISSTGGGKIFVKKGTYVTDRSITVGPSDGSMVSNFVQIQGEGRDSTILQFSGAAASADMIKAYTGFMLDNIFLDCSGVATAGVSTTGTTHLLVANCHIKNCLGISISTNMNSLGTIVRNNWFDVHSSTSAQVKIGGNSGYYNVEGNYFDRATAGVANGNNILVIGGSANGGITIRGNVFNRGIGNITNAISLDPTADSPRTNGFENIVIDGNTVVNGTITVGVSGSTWTNTFSKITVTNNNIDGGSIDIRGPDTNFTNSVKHITVANNNIRKAYNWGMMCFRVAGPIILSQNIVNDSNQSLTSIGSTIDNGLVEVKNSNLVDVIGNQLFMVDTRTNANPYAIRLNSNSEVRVYNNKISNATTNPDIQTDGLNLKLKIQNNLGYLTQNSGVFTATSDAGLAYTVSHGMDVAPDVVIIDAGTSKTGQDKWISAITPTTFTATYTVVPSAGLTWPIYWHAAKVNFS